MPRARSARAGISPLEPHVFVCVNVFVVFVFFLADFTRASFHFAREGQRCPAVSASAYCARQGAGWPGGGKRLMYGLSGGGRLPREVGRLLCCVGPVRCVVCRDNIRRSRRCSGDCPLSELGVQHLSGTVPRTLSNRSSSS